MNTETNNNNNHVQGNEEEAFEGMDETQPKYRSLQIQHDTQQPLLPQPQRQSKIEDDTARTARWNPRRVNQYQSNYQEQKICAEKLITVAHRIYESNRVRSIETEYDDDTATAKCMAPRNTTLRIALFHGETENHIIVDIRRMGGCSLVFQEEYRAIMKAAKLGEITPSKKVDLGIRKKAQETTDYIPLKKGVLEENLVSNKSFLGSECHDTCVLALEDMAFTTNSDDSSDDTALNASKLIMEEVTGIRDSVASIILKKEVTAFDGQYIRSLALTILSNVLSTLSKENILIPLIQDEWYRSSLMPSLIDEIKTAAKHPCNATLATKCLSALFDSTEACAEAGEDTMIALEAARKIGELSDANLETESKVAIEKMVQWIECKSCEDKS